MEELDIRPLKEEDYDSILLGWWKDWGWTPPYKDFLPDGGKGGLLILDGDTPICAGFLYATNSKVAWVEFVVSNKKYTDKQKRKIALNMLIESLTNIAKNMGYHYCYSIAKNEPLLNIYTNNGYVSGGDNITEMIKTL